MTVKVISEQEVLQEAAEVLLQHMAPAKVARLWAAWRVGGGNYLAIREHLFGGETATTLYEKVEAYQKNPQEQEH
jgi:hypothetical protein